MTKHFPAHHNDRTSLTSAVISEFKVHEMRQRMGLCPGPRWGSLQHSPRPLSWIRGGKWDKDGGELGKESREGEGRGERGKGREGGEGRWRGEIDGRAAGSYGWTIQLLSTVLRVYR